MYDSVDCERTMIVSSSTQRKEYVRKTEHYFFEKSCCSLFSRVACSFCCESWIVAWSRWPIHRRLSLYYHIVFIFTSLLFFFARFMPRSQHGSRHWFWPPPGCLFLSSPVALSSLLPRLFLSTAKPTVIQFCNKQLLPLKSEDQLLRQ